MNNIKEFFDRVYENMKLTVCDILDLDITFDDHKPVTLSKQVKEFKEKLEESKSILEDESFDSTHSAIGDIEYEISYLENCKIINECGDDITNLTIKDLQEKLKDLKYELRNEKFTKIENHLEDLYNLFYNLNEEHIDHMDDIIMEYKSLKNNYLDTILNIFDDLLNNDGEIDIIDYFYIKSEHRNEFLSLWNQMNRKKKIEKILNNIK